MTDKLEMPIEQFAEAVSIETARLYNRIEKLEALLEQRDLFIVDRGLWVDFVSTLVEKPCRPVFKEGYRAVEEAMGHPSPEFWVERKYEY